MRLTFTLPFLSVLWSFLQLLPGATSPAAVSTPVVSAPPATSTAVNAADTRSLEFVENKGQWDKRVQYAADIPSGRLYLQPNSFQYVLHDPVAFQNRHPHENTSARPVSDELKGHAYSVTFVGANAAPVVQAQEPTAGTRNYFLGNDQSKWGSGAKGYRSVQYQNLYTGVNMALYEQEKHLKYDLQVAAGTSPDQIQIQYTGANRVSLQNGALKIETSIGYVTEHKPIAYQLKGKQRVAVPCEYVLEGETLRFRFPKGYNAKLPLVIDPVVEFSSFTGSTADNWGFTATYDSEGNMYSGGIAFGSGYPTNQGAFRTTWSGSVDIAVIKYNTNVSGNPARLYATYLGGTNAECPHSLVVNAEDELLILATTGSQNFPVSTSAFQGSFKGGTSIAPLGAGGNPTYTLGSDLAITRLSKTGTTLIASTFLGGSANDGLLERLTPLVQNYGDQHRADIITDPEGNVYIASNTSSSDFPISNGLGQTYQGGYSDAVISKLSPDLSTLVWSSTYGNSRDDAAYSIQLDQDRNVYVAGGTNSTSLPGTQNGLTPTPSGGVDGYVLKMDASGRSIAAATFLGTPSYDQVYFVQLDEGANVYVLGQSTGAYPVSGNVFSTANGKQFIHKLNNQLNATVFSTVFGSTDPQYSLDINISPTAFLVDDCERLYVSGWGGGTNISYGNGTMFDMPTTADAIQTTTQDGRDFYLMQLSAGAAELLYATYYGAAQSGISSGEHVDGGTSRFDKKGIVYQAVCGGCGGSDAFPFPPGAQTYSSINNSTNCNNAAFKFNFEISAAGAGQDRMVCVNDGPIPLNGSPTGGTWIGPGVTLQNGQYFFTPSPTLTGPQVLTYTVPNTGACSRSGSRTFTVMAPQDISFTSLPPVICLQGAVPITMAGTPGEGTFSGPGVTNNIFNPVTAGLGTHTITFSMEGLGNCATVSQTVQIVNAVQPSAGPDTVLCPGSNTPFQLRGTPANGIWSGQYVTAAGMFSPPAGFTGSVQLTYSITNQCTASDFKTISVSPLPVFQASVLNEICENYPTISGYAPFTASFENSTTNATSFTWDFGDGGQSTDAVPEHVYVQPGTYTITLTARYGNGCSEQTQVGQVIVENNFIPNIITPNEDGLNDTFIQRFSCLPTELRIFNRWGKQVHQVEVYRQNWGGGGLSEGTYFYLLKDTAGKTAKGWLEIIR